MDGEGWNAAECGRTGIGLFRSFTLDEDFYTRKDLTSKVMGIRVSSCNLDLCIRNERCAEYLN